jgi:preprotein translocase subunit YajC
MVFLEANTDTRYNCQSTRYVIKSALPGDGVEDMGYILQIDQKLA